METEVKNTEEAAPVAAATESTNTPTTVVEQETQEQINWKKFRAAREEERKKHMETEKRAREKEAEAAALKAAMEAILNKPQAHIATPMVEESRELTEDEVLQQKIDRLFAERERNEAEKRRKQDQEELPQKLAANFKDFDHVCSADNVDYLEFHYPEVAEGFKHMPDGYNKWATIYKAVKKLVPNTDSKREANKAEKNFNKPQAMSIAGKTQVGDSAPQMLDDKRKAENWKRMQQRMRGGT